MLRADTGLPFVGPSPNLPSPDAVTVYNGTCMLAGTNVSEGAAQLRPLLPSAPRSSNPKSWQMR